MRPNISTGVSAVGEQRPTSNQIPYRPNCCRSSGDMLSGTKPLGAYAVPAVDPLLPFFFISADSLPGSKFSGLASLSRLITHSTICICISASICQAGAISTPEGAAGVLTGSSTSTHIDELHLETTSHYIRQLLSIAEAAAEGLGILKWKESLFKHLGNRNNLIELKINTIAWKTITLAYIKLLTHLKGRQSGCVLLDEEEQWFETALDRDLRFRPLSVGFRHSATEVAWNPVQRNQDAVSAAF
ncbi:hypothetical protein GQX74_000862 [Glossina fuscipes]|nr:hypothetical protein GQX74_000862 [Glossina fuscipes]